VTGQIIHQMKGNFMEVQKNNVTKPGCVENVKRMGVIGKWVFVSVRTQIDVKLVVM
jgi:hypothetical protein